MVSAETPADKASWMKELRSAAETLLKNKATLKQTLH